MADILTLADARTALRLATADTSNDTDLTATYIPATTAVCESVAGPIMTATMTRTYDGGRPSVQLPWPATAVTSVTQSGITLNANTDYSVDLAAGIVYCGLFPVWADFTAGIQTISVTFSVGYAAAAANVTPAHKLAARIILRHLFQADQQGVGAGRQINGVTRALVDGDLVGTPTGYLIPNRAYELLRPSDKTPGFA